MGVRCSSRRHFLRGSLALAGLGLLSGCGILPPQGQQPSKVRRIGVLLDTAGTATVAFRQALSRLGWVDGESALIEYRFLKGRYYELPQIVAELLRLEVDVIVAESTPMTRAAQTATTTIPIVMTLTDDPVDEGIVASLAHPGGNVTGLSQHPSPLAGKRLEVLKEVVPGLSRVAVLSILTSPASALQGTRVAAGALGVQVQGLEVREPIVDFEGAFEATLEERADAVIVLPDPVFSLNRSRMVYLAAKSRLPAMHYERPFAVVGGLMAYAPDLSDSWERAAVFVDKILKGAKPAELPVEQPTKFEFVINLKTAQALGLPIPQSVLLHATELI